MSDISITQDYMGQQTDRNSLRCNLTDDLVQAIINSLHRNWTYAIILDQMCSEI